MVSPVAENGDVGRRCQPAVQKDSLSPSLERLIVRVTLHVDVVLFGVLVTRMREPVSHLAVVGEQNQPLAPQVEPPYREESARQRHQVPYSGKAARTVPLVGEDASGFVESHVCAAALHPHRPPVHGDTVAGLVGLLAQLGHPPVDRDSPLADQFFTGPAGSDARTG